MNGDTIEEWSERMGMSKSRAEQLQSLFSSTDRFVEFMRMTPEEQRSRRPTRRPVDHATRDRALAEWVASISDRKIHILTVSDLAWHHRLVRKSLAAAGFIVREFTNGSQWVVQSRTTNKDS